MDAGAVVGPGHRGQSAWRSQDWLRGRSKGVMSVMGYVFQRGDAVMLPAAYNGKVGLAILCPTTKQVKGHPLEVEIPSGQAGEG